MANIRLLLGLLALLAKIPKINLLATKYTRSIHGIVPNGQTKCRADEVEFAMLLALRFSEVELD